MKDNKAKPKAKGTPRVSQLPKSDAKTKSPSKPKGKVKADPRSRSTGDWRAETLASIRDLILEVDPEVVEEQKWIKPSNPAGVPVWSQAGIICTGETYKQVVKLTFAKGASLKDPEKLFNSSLEGNTRRAIDIHEGEVLDTKAFKALILAAIAENLRTSGAKSKSGLQASAKAKPDASKAKLNKPPKKEAGVVLLSGGNPQIEKADGDIPVQAYIAAMPGWKHDIGKRLDALIVRTVPNVLKAVKWNTPFYGIAGQGWFLGFHCITKYVKVAFFRGASLQPVPPVASKQREVRYLHIHENDDFDEAQFAAWVKQASQLPGERM